MKRRACSGRGSLGDTPAGHSPLPVRGECYQIDTTGRADGFDSIWQRFMDRVIAETKLVERFEERDLRAKAATDAESLAHARALLAHANEATTKRIYRRKAERVKPSRGVKSEGRTS